MNQYIDIELIPDPEFPPPVLMGALFGKLHRVLVALEASSIGVSFPGYAERPRTLGARLRLHGSRSVLEDLMSRDWLSGMHDHVSVSAIGTVPTEGVQHRVVRRRQLKTNAERLRRRRARRHGETLEQARAHIPDAVERKTNLPYVTLRSASTGERFSLFVEHGEPQDQPRAGSFSRYGLSRGATIPWF